MDFRGCWVGEESECMIQCRASGMQGTEDEQGFCLVGRWEK